MSTLAIDTPAGVRHVERSRVADPANPMSGDQKVKTALRHGTAHKPEEPRRRRRQGPDGSLLGGRGRRLVQPEDPAR